MVMCNTGNLKTMMVQPANWRLLSDVNLNANGFIPRLKGLPLLIIQYRFEYLGPTVSLNFYQV